MANNIEQISMDELIYEATHDMDTIRDAKFIEESKGYPSPQKLKELGLTEAGYLLLSGAINTVPGGAASPLTDYLLTSPIEQALATGQKQPITTLLMDHGSLITIGSGAFRNVAEYNSKRADGSNTIQSGYELHLTHLHAETSCGPSEGNSLNTRNMFVKNVVGLQDRLNERIGMGTMGRILDVEVHAVEAYVGRQLGPMPGNRAFDVHSVSSVRYLYSTPQELRHQLEEGIELPINEDDERFYDNSGLNAAIRNCMNDGRLIVGEACLDRRQGLSAMRHDFEAQKLEELRESIMQNRNIFRRGLQGVDWPTTAWQAEAHSEAPLVLLNIGQDEMMTRLGLWMMRHGGALNRNNRYLAPTAPAIINVPEEMFGFRHRKEAGIFANQITQLVANLDRATYGRSLFMKQNRSPFYVEIDEKMYEVDMPAGMQVAHSAKAEKLVGNLRIPQWFYSDLRAKPMDMNPSLGKVVTTRSLGPVVE